MKQDTYTPPKRRPWLRLTLIFTLLALTTTFILFAPLILFQSQSLFKSQHPHPQQQQQQQQLQKALHKLPPSLNLIDDQRIRLEKRDSSSGDKNYTVTGFLGDGLFTELLIGSDQQRLLFSIDTSLPFVLVNNYTYTSHATTREKTLAGFDTRNSTTFVNLYQDSNLYSIDNESAYGTEVSDYIALSNNATFPDSIFFTLSGNNTLNVKNTNVVWGSTSKLVIDTSNSTDSKTYPSNIFGLALSESPYSLLNQMIAANLSQTSLFSLYVDESQISVIHFGAVDPSKYLGRMYLTSLLPYSYVDSVTDIKYRYPFVTLSGITLNNYEHNTSLNLSSNGLSIPTLLDTSSAMSYLPYSLLVELASQFGAYFSSEHSLWIQSCSLRSINGTIGFQFYNQTIQVPIQSLFVPLINSDGDSLYLESGDLACALAFSPAEVRGFSSLGTPFFQAAYVLFDYENLLIGLAPVDTSNSSSDTSLVEVYSDVGAVVDATTMNAGWFTPTAVILSPQPLTDYVSSSGARTIDADRLLTSPPASTTTTADNTVATTAFTSRPEATGSNAFAVSVSPGGDFEGSASDLVRSNIFFMVLAFCFFLCFSF